MLLVLVLGRKGGQTRTGHFDALAPAPYLSTQRGGGGRRSSSLKTLVGHGPLEFLQTPPCLRLFLLKVLLGMRPYLLRTPRAQQAGNVFPGPAMFLVTLQKQGVLFLAPAPFSDVLPRHRRRRRCRHRRHIILLLLLLLLLGGLEGRRRTWPSRCHGQRHVPHEGVRRLVVMVVVVVEV
jgi:hypothetical protein